MQLTNTFNNSHRDKKSVGEGSNSTAEKRSNTVLKERIAAERIGNLFQTPNMKGLSEKRLPLLAG